MMYTFRFTEEEVAYIRKAVCVQNMKHCLRGLEAEAEGNALEHRVNMDLRSIGRGVLHIIDKTKEYQ